MSSADITREVVSIPFVLPSRTGVTMLVRVLETVDKEVVAYGTDCLTGVRTGALVTNRLAEVGRRRNLAITGTLHQTIGGQADETGKIVTARLPEHLR